MGSGVGNIPDGPHMHPKVLGHAQPASYAGDVAVKDGKVIEVTNLSGTFQFDDEQGLLEVAQALESQGMKIEKGWCDFSLPAAAAR